MVQLNTLKDNAGSTQKRVRVGRGKGSGLGKTCGRGYKGQKSRTGVRLNGFEGGQTPLHRRLPKRGFVNPTRLEFAVVNVWEIQNAITSGAITVDHVTKQVLKDAGIIHCAVQLVKLLSKGDITKAITLEIDAASQEAAKKIQSAGGKLQLSKVLADKRAKKEAKHQHHPKKKISSQDEE